MKRLLLIPILCAVCSAQMLPKPMLGRQINRSHRLSKGLVLCLPFMEKPGKLGKVYDLSGNGNHGTLVADTHSVPGKFGPALDFDGTGDSVTFTTNGILHNSGSICFWVRFNNNLADADDDYLFSHYWSAERIYIVQDGVTDQDDKLSYRLGASVLVVTQSIAINTWHQVVLTWKGSGGDGNATFSLDGINISETSYLSLDAIGSNVHLGSYTDSSNFFTGQIDHLLIYNRALSAGEISQLYIEKFPMFKKEPIAYWYVAPAVTAGQVIMIIGN